MVDRASACCNRIGTFGFLIPTKISRTTTVSHPPTYADRKWKSNLFFVLNFLFITIISSSQLVEKIILSALNTVKKRLSESLNWTCTSRWEDL